MRIKIIHHKKVVVRLDSGNPWTHKLEIQMKKQPCFSIGLNRFFYRNRCILMLRSSNHMIPRLCIRHECNTTILCKYVLNITVPLQFRSKARA